MTAEGWKKAGRWALYTLLFLMTMVTETIFLAHVRPFGTRLSLVPVVLLCIAAREGAESGGLFVLLASFFWCLSGDADSALCVFTLTAAAVAAGGLCGTWLTRALAPAMAFCLLGLILSQGGSWLLRLYLAEPMPEGSGLLVCRQVGLSVLTAPVFWGLTRLIGKQ